ncbi:MAG TPA: alpha/beta hydrolase [Nannocystaceae bacterium]|nr:alpha/beta hydrolase [Nannocystaceae bacterium]
MAETRTIDVGDGQIEVFLGGAEDPEAPVLAAAHPASAYEAATVELLAATSGARIVCVNPRGLGGSSAIPSDRPWALADMVDDVETVRRRLGLGKWIFWGMSGGGWLAQIYAHRHPSSLGGVVIESACACFRERLADRECVLSPFFPPWGDALDDAGLLQADSHAEPSDARDGEWIEVEGVGSVFHRPAGPALVVAPFPVDAAMRRAMPILWEHDARLWLPSVRVPALVVAGTEDAVVPIARAREVHDAIAGARLVVVEGAGHVPTVERRPEVETAVRGFVTSRC